MLDSVTWYLLNYDYEQQQWIWKSAENALITHDGQGKVYTNMIEQHYKAMISLKVGSLEYEVQL